MHRADFPLYVLKIVLSFLQHRSYHVAVNGHVSDRHEVLYGVPQGAVLSPTLYNIFTADLAMIDGVSYFLFADDTGYLASDSDPVIVVTKLQAAQNAIERYQKKWKVKTNAEKSQAIFREVSLVHHSTSSNVSAIIVTDSDQKVLRQGSASRNNNLIRDLPAIRCPVPATKKGFAAPVPAAKEGFAAPVPATKEGFASDPHIICRNGEYFVYQAAGVVFACGGDSVQCLDTFFKAFSVFNIKVPTKLIKISDFLDVLVFKVKSYTTRVGVRQLVAEFQEVENAENSVQDINS
ncbi:hypothetical protein quinque_015986 [Culex quinquefasciatus]